MNIEQIVPVVDAHLNPVQDVTDALRAAGHPNPEDWLQHVHSFYPQALDQTTSGTGRRVLVNRVLHVVLGLTDHPESGKYRFLLIDQGSHEEWLGMIQKEVAPLMARIAKD